ncbi:hypothetical protein ABGB12_19460 [Actinocorallia sp. B10E7]|uniref:hypothetical protein n=1 Tax=Actinocorallia sp. B10E7 TaxID=3153558 RepID=UPI00325E6D8F
MTTVAVRRLPALLGAGPALAAGVWGGPALLGLGVPLPRQAFAAQHGPLMALGFLGTLIALERAVALGRTWGYAAPALGALGAVALAAFVATAVVTAIRKPSRPVRTPRAQAARSARPASPKEPS